jgi:RND family efflux transporter MFP subunit
MTKPRRRWTVAALALVLLAVGGTWIACRGSLEHAGHAGGEEAVARAAKYHCPMHPTYVSDKPGDCPICGMRLVPIELRSSARNAERKVVYYRSPHDPAVRSAVPAKDSMGMDFVPVYEDELGAASSVGGRVAVDLTPERRRVLGLRTEAVAAAELGRAIPTVGRVTPDERRLHHIHTKFEAYVEHLHVDFTGKFVNRGEPLASLYSPELVATQQEYLLAWRGRKQFERASIGGVSEGASALLTAARQRLLLWDIRGADIERLERSGEVRRTLELFSPVSGYVTQKMAVHGMRVTPADTLFDIADLSHVWVLADVYEADLAAVPLGSEAELSVAYVPGKTWAGKVTHVAPNVEEKTRTVKVRIEVANTRGELKPDMFADVQLKTGAGMGLVVPESALLRSGERTLAFVETADGRLEPRELRLGQKTANGVQVLSGLSEGERVVTSANFLIDSESSLQAALQTLAPAAEHKH